MAFAIDRSRVAQIGEYGYEPAANQAGVITPDVPALARHVGAEERRVQLRPGEGNLDPGKGRVQARLGRRTFDSPQGKPLSFTIINQIAYTDWVAALQVVSQELSSVGIELTVDNLAGTDYGTKLYDGNYQLAYGYEAGGPTPYYEFRQWLYGPGSAPIGKPAATNWERYSSSATDQLIDSYAESTDAATQHRSSTSSSACFSMTSR